MATSRTIQYELSAKATQAQAALAEFARSLRATAKDAQLVGGGLESGLGRARRGVEAVSQQLSTLRRDLVAIFSLRSAVAAGRELVTMADSAARLNAQLRLATTSEQEFLTARQGVVAIAQATGQALDATAQAYARNARAIAALGGSQADALGVTEALTLTMRVQNTTAAEGAASMQQFSQAVGSGRLAGDELKSILENNQRLARALADGLGVSTGALREMGAAGQLTADKALQALLSQLSLLRQEAAGLPDTVETSSTRVRNAFLLFAESSEAVQSLRSTVVGALTGIAENFDAVARSVTFAAGAIAAAISGRLVAALVALVARFAAAGAAAAVFGGAMTLLGGPIGVVITLLGTAAVAFATFGRNTEEAADKAEAGVRRLKKAAADASDPKALQASLDEQRKVLAAYDADIARLQKDKEAAAKQGALPYQIGQLTQQIAKLQMERNRLNAAIEQAAAAAAPAAPQGGGWNQAKLAGATKELADFTRELRTEEERLEERIAGIRDAAKRYRDALSALILSRTDLSPQEQQAAIAAYAAASARQEADLIARERAKAAKKAQGRSGIGAQFSLDRTEISALKRSLDAELGLVRDALGSARGEYDRAYEQGVIGLEGYYAARMRIIEAAGEQELARNRELTEALQRELASTRALDPKTDSERQRVLQRTTQLQAEIAELEARTLKISNDLARSRKENADELERARRALQLQRLEIENQVAAAQGTLSREQIRKLAEAQNAQLLAAAQASAQETGDDSFVRVVRQKIELEIDQASYDQVRAAVDRIFQDMNNAGDALRNSGFEGDALERRFRPIKEAALTRLHGLLPLLEELGATTTDVRIRLDVEGVKTQIEALKKSATDLGVAFENSAVSGFGQLFVDVGTRAKSAVDAINDFGRSVQRVMLDLIGRKLGERLLESLFPSKGGSGGSGLSGILQALVGWMFGGGGGAAPISESTPTLRRAGGGPVFGPGGPRDDLVPAWLSNGEYVIRAAAVREYGLAFFDAINGMRARAVAPGARLADGGLMAAPRERTRLGSATAIVNNYYGSERRGQRESDGQSAARMKIALDQAARNL